MLIYNFLPIYIKTISVKYQTVSDNGWLCGEKVCQATIVLFYTIPPHTQLQGDS